MSNPEQTSANLTKALSREELRAAIFANARPKSKICTFFGQEVELKQPPMSAVLELQQLEDRAKAAAQMIVRYSYVLGTNEKVFDDADIDLISQMPFGGDLAAINTAIGELTDIDILGEEKNSGTPLDIKTSSS